MHEPRLRVAVTARAVHPWHGQGGLERHVGDLIRHLMRLDVAVTLIVPPPSRAGAFPPLAPAHADHLLRVLAVPYRSFPGAGRRGTTIIDRDTAYPVFGWRAGRAAAHLAAQGAVDIVHGLGASVFGYAAAKRRNRQGLPPLVLNPQGMEEFGATDPQLAGWKVPAYWPLRLVVRMCAHEADAVLATDDALVSTVIEHLDVLPSQVAVVPNAVDLEWCARLATSADGLALRRARGIDADVAVLLSVGRLERNKGLHDLAAALGRVAARRNDWRWVVVGDGPFRKQLEQAVADAAIGSRIIWAGRVSDAELHAWYEAADMFAHPTRYEGSSLVTLEAMAHARPVLATRAGGLPDKVRPDVTGWLVPPGDVAALAEALGTALDSRPRWREMGSAGRRVAERDFSWPAVAARLVGVYERLLRGRTTQRTP